jgi:hypothetical protein
VRKSKAIGIPPGASAAFIRIAACGRYRSCLNILFTRPHQLHRLADRLGDRDDSAPVLDCRFVIALQLAAEDPTIGDRRVDHAIEPRVDTEFRGAVNLQGRIEPGPPRPDQLD